jgi:hypothetical protein
LFQLSLRLPTVSWVPISTKNLQGNMDSTWCLQATALTKQD